MKITDLEKRFNGFAIHINSLNLNVGQLHGLIGPNGSGKTTVMKLMAGLMEADSGNIEYEGLVPRDITMVPRKPYFLHDSVYRNLVYPLALRKIKPDPEKVDFCLEMSGLQNRRKQYAPSLSTGEQQKLSIMRALIFSPKLILIDEAFSNLDIESVSMLERYIISRQQTDPATWVVISHQLSHIQRLCNYVMFMDNGELKAEGPTEDMLFRPQIPQLIRYLQYEALVATQRMSQ